MIISRRREAARIVSKWRKPLFLHEWYFDLHYPEENLNESTIADISANPTYLKAHIRIFPLWSDLSPTLREETLVHELLHCHTQRLWDLAQNLLNGVLVPHHSIHDEVELLTQRLTNVVFYSSLLKRP